jgi:ribulose-5-phosphate 4-epimerase/fuculose-1-phosphate aldolase
MNTRSNSEAALRRDVAACTRMLVHEGILGYSGHVSARLPKEQYGRDAILIQPGARSRFELEADELLVVDFDGKVLAGKEHGKPPSEVFIHTEIMKARPDVAAVAHFHPETATLFTLVDDVPFRPVKNHAARWIDGTPVHPDASHVDTPASGASLADTLGRHEAALIRAHGAVVVAEDVRALFVDCVHFEENADALYRAAAIGRVNPLSTEEAKSFLSSFDRAEHAVKLWTYYVGRARAANVLEAGYEA